MKKQINLNDEMIDVEVINQTASFVLFEVEGEQYSINLNKVEDYKVNLSYNGSNKSVVVAGPYFVANGKEFAIASKRKGRNISKISNLGQMTSPMPGKILKIMVKVGDKVEIGKPILIMEAMKMEHTIKANKDGVIDEIFYKEGDQVTGGVELVKLC